MCNFYIVTVHRLGGDSVTDKRTYTQRDTLLYITEDTTADIQIGRDKLA
jgi:hypothetical protein